MANKVTSSKFWDILCFISLGLFAITRLLELLNITAPWFGPFVGVCNLLIGIMILVSAWNAVAGKKKGWKTTYWVFVAIVLISSILPIVLSLIQK
ncbi:MAG: hypothetical protein J1F32_02695 [Erysipelotrichales bacterium]|nr:hypothetical protein [Erysipelotrichales bacterium]